ncbi:MAG: hypothetical protein FWF90_16385 [Promicromonosporaceae bacterium]|nr:hypothetical protein [Promicromonosporaceae bacterium]
MSRPIASLRYTSARLSSNSASATGMKSMSAQIASRAALIPERISRYAPWCPNGFARSPREPERDRPAIRPISVTTPMIRPDIVANAVPSCPISSLRRNSFGDSFKSNCPIASSRAFAVIARSGCVSICRSKRTNAAAKAVKQARMIATPIAEARPSSRVKSDFGARIPRVQGVPAIGA